MPELAAEFSYSGFEAFVEYWFEARNYALATGDVERMLVVSDDRCGFCLKHQQGIEEIYDAEGWVVGGDLVPRDFVTNLSELKGGVYHAFFRLKQVDGTAYDSDGEEMDEYTFTPDIYEYEFFAFYDKGSGWSAALIDLEEVAE